MGLCLLRPACHTYPARSRAPSPPARLNGSWLCLAWLLGVCLALATSPAQYAQLYIAKLYRADAAGHPAEPMARPAAHAPRAGPPPRPLRPDRPHSSRRGRTTPDSPSVTSPPTRRPRAPADGDSRTISIAVLGPLAIDGLTGESSARRRYELLAYLALHSNGASRDELIEAIWPAQDPERTRPRFWQSVTEARKALGDAWVHHGERYELDRSKVRVDLDDLDRLLAANSDDTSHDPAALESALALWRGEPLEGSDYLWAEGEVRVLHATLVDLLERVGRSRLAREDARGALQMADQAIALDGLHESSWRLALQAEHALGLRESITRRYDELTRSLDEQLGLEPARETRLVYRQLLGQT